MQYNRNQDLMKVFDARWKANHDNNIDSIIERDKIRSKKILSSNPNDYLSESDFENIDNTPEVQSSREIQLDRLQKNMDALRQNRGNFNG